MANNNFVLGQDVRKNNHPPQTKCIANVQDLLDDNDTGKDISENDDVFSESDRECELAGKCSDEYSSAFDDIMDNLEPISDIDDQSDSFDEEWDDIEICRTKKRLVASTPCLSTVCQLKTFIENKLSEHDGATSLVTACSNIQQEKRNLSTPRTPEPQPLTKSNVTIHDNVWSRHSSVNGCIKSELSPPLKSIGDVKVCNTLWRANVDILENLSDSSTSSMDTVIAMTHAERRRNKMKIVKSQKAAFVDRAGKSENNQTKIKICKQTNKFQGRKEEDKAVTRLTPCATKVSVPSNSDKHGINQQTNDVHYANNETNNKVNVSSESICQHPTKLSTKVHYRNKSIPSFRKMNEELRKSLKQKHEELDTSLEKMLRMLTVGEMDSKDNNNTPIQSNYDAGCKRIEIDGLSNKDIDILSSVVQDQNKPTQQETLINHQNPLHVLSTISTGIDSPKTNNKFPLTFKSSSQTEKVPEIPVAEKMLLLRTNSVPSSYDKRETYGSGFALSSKPQYAARSVPFCINEVENQIQLETQESTRLMPENGSSNKTNNCVISNSLTDQEQNMENKSELVNFIAKDNARMEKIYERHRLHKSSKLHQTINKNDHQELSDSEGNSKLPPPMMLWNHKYHQKNWQEVPRKSFDNLFRNRQHILGLVSPSRILTSDVFNFTSSSVAASTPNLSQQYLSGKDLFYKTNQVKESQGKLSLSIEANNTTCTSNTLNGKYIQVCISPKNKHPTQETSHTNLEQIPFIDEDCGQNDISDKPFDPLSTERLPPEGQSSSPRISVDLSAPSSRDYVTNHSTSELTSQKRNLSCGKYVKTAKNTKEKYHFKNQTLPKCEKNAEKKDKKDGSVRHKFRSSRKSSIEKCRPKSCYV